MEECHLKYHVDVYTDFLMGMCRWMGSLFHDWIDYNGVAFLTELLACEQAFGRTGSLFTGYRFTRMGSHIFGFWGVKPFIIFTVSKRTRMFVL